MIDPDEELMRDVLHILSRHKELNKMKLSHSLDTSLVIRQMNITPDKWNLPLPDK